MPSRLKVIVAYDGTPFAGWQSQANGNAVQDHVERAFAAICGERIRVHGAGRTDAGVHALAQSAHADVPHKRLTAAQWVAALNQHLPAAIRILRAGYVNASFHAQYSAIGKVYRYEIWQGAVLPPFERDRAWHIRAPIDIHAVRGAAALFEGRHDFAAFAARRGKHPETTIRTIRAVTVRSGAKRLSLTFDGDGFLYKMVRLIVGTLVLVGRGEETEDAIRRALRRGHAPAILRRRLVAPAAGLTLVRVRY